MADRRRLYVPVDAEKNIRWIDGEDQLKEMEKIAFKSDLGYNVYEFTLISKVRRDRETGKMVHQKVELKPRKPRDPERRRKQRQAKSSQVLLTE